MDKHNINKYFNKEVNITATCRSNTSWNHGEYSELIVGEKYKVSHIGVLRSSTRIILEDFPSSVYNSTCFDLFENNAPLIDYTHESRFLAPYIRDKYKEETETMLIPGCLKKLEREHEIKVLFAVESGSRAWGFESENSDWDVRFIYVHKPEWYFRVDEPRDVIEHVFEEDIDVVGWELRRTLKLLKNGNISLFEWFHSPIVYYANKEFEQRILSIEKDFFNPVKAMYHYNSIYNKHNDRYLKRDGCHMKRFLYYLRGMYACRWIEEKQAIPPVKFMDLVEAMEPDAEIRHKIYALIEIKKGGREGDMHAVDKTLLAHAEKWANYYNEHIDSFRPERDNVMTDKLDSILFDMVHLNDQ